MPFDASSLRAAGDPAGIASVDAWLADEVAVDFPSVRPLVDRMRTTLLGDDDPASGALSAEVRLTVQQARRGGRVAVDVPLRQVCRRCGGRGEVWGEPCAGCGGHGDGVRRRTVDVFVPPGVRAGACLVLLVGPPLEPATRVHLRVSVG